MNLMDGIRYREFRNELVNMKVEKFDASKSSILRVLMLVDDLISVVLKPMSSM